MATEIRKATGMALPSHSPLKQAKRQPLATAPTRPQPAPTFSRLSVGHERLACAHRLLAEAHRVEGFVPR
jgi:hypothetical protein